MAAQKDFAALEKFVRYTARSTIIGADRRASSLSCAALLFNGVMSFAKVVSDADPKQKRVSLGLGLRGVTNFNKRFPETYRLVVTQEE